MIKLLLLLALTLAVFAFPVPIDDYESPPNGDFEAPPFGDFEAPPFGDFEAPPFGGFQEEENEYEILDGGNDPFGPFDEGDEIDTVDSGSSPFVSDEGDEIDTVDSGSSPFVSDEGDEIDTVDSGSSPFVSDEEDGFFGDNVPGSPPDDIDDPASDFFGPPDDVFVPSDDIVLPPEDYLGAPEEAFELTELAPHTGWRVALTASQQDHAATVDPITVSVFLNNRKTKTQPELAFEKGIKQGQTIKSTKFSWEGSRSDIPSHFCLKKKGTDGLRVTSVTLYWASSVYKGFWDKHPSGGELVKEAKWHCIKVKEVFDHKDKAKKA